jgi:hypothetical protein
VDALDDESVNVTSKQSLPARISTGDEPRKPFSYSN